MSTSTADRKISVEMQQIADELEKQLEEIAGTRMGFSLVVFNTEPGSRLNYVSNCARADVAGAYQALLTGWGAGMPDIPAHETN